MTELVGEHGTSSWSFIASKLVGGGRNGVICRARWICLSKRNFTTEATSSSNSSSTKKKATPEPSSNLEGGSDSDDASPNDGACADHDLFDNGTHAMASAAPPQPERWPKKKKKEA